MGTLATLPNYSDEDVENILASSQYQNNPFNPDNNSLQPMQPNYSLLPDSVSEGLMLPQLPSFENQAPTLPTVTPENSSPSNSGFLQGLLHPLNTAQQLTQNATGQTLGGILKLSLEDFIFIVLGLLLIAAGVFSFKQTQTIVREGGRAAATIAAA